MNSSLVQFHSGRKGFSANMEEKKVYVVAILCQLLNGGNYIFSKDVLNGGMPTTIFAFYRLFVGSLVLVPLALVFGRKNAPKLTWKIAAKIFVLALFGTTFILNIFAIGVRLTSSSVSSAFSNAVPVVTFALAVLLRTESVTVQKLSGITKLLGVVLCLAGVLVLAFYEGPNIKFLNYHRAFLHASNYKHEQHSKVEWIIGTFILIIFSIAWSLWLILQGPILKEYPSKILFTTICTFFGAMQSFIVALIAERDFNKWKLHLDDSLVAVLYTGIVISALLVYMQLWCIEKKGAVFTSIWQPLSLLITLACSSFVLGEIIKLGSVLGGLLMVGGLYSVLWGKHRDNLEKKSSIEQEINCPFLISENASNLDHAICP